MEQVVSHRCSETFLRFSALLAKKRRPKVDMSAADLLRELEANKTDVVICRRATRSLAILTQNPAEAAALSKRDVDLLLEIMSNHLEDSGISGLICMVLVSMAEGGGIAKLLDADLITISGAFLRAQLDAGNRSGALTSLVLLVTLRKNPRAQTEMIREGILRHIVKALELFPGDEEIETTSHGIALELRVSHREEAYEQVNAALAASPRARSIRSILGFLPPAPAPVAPAPAVPAVPAVPPAPPAPPAPAPVSPAAAAASAAQADRIANTLRGILRRMRVGGSRRLEEGLLAAIVQGMGNHPGHAELRRVSREMVDVFRTSHPVETLRQLEMVLSTSPHAARIREELGLPAPPPVAAPGGVAPVAAPGGVAPVAAPGGVAPASAAVLASARAYARAAALAAPGGVAPAPSFPLAAQAERLASAMRFVLMTVRMDGVMEMRLFEVGFLEAIVQGLEHHPGHVELRKLSREMVDVFRATNSAETLRQLEMALSTSPHAARIREELGLPAPPLPTVPPPSPFPVEAFEPVEIETVAIPAEGKSSDHAILCVLRHGVVNAFALSEDTLTNYKTSPDWMVYRCKADIEGFAIRRNQVKGEPLRRFNLDVPIYLRHSDAQQIVKGQTYLLTEGAERVGHIASERLLVETEKMYRGEAYNESMAVSADHCQDDKPNLIYNVSLVAFGAAVAASGGKRTRRRRTHRKATRRSGRSRRNRRL